MQKLLLWLLLFFIIAAFVVVVFDLPKGHYLNSFEALYDPLVKLGETVEWFNAGWKPNDVTFKIDDVLVIYTIEARFPDGTLKGTPFNIYIAALVNNGVSVKYKVFGHQIGFIGMDIPFTSVKLYEANVKLPVNGKTGTIEIKEGLTSSQKDIYMNYNTLYLKKEVTTLRKFLLAHPDLYLQAEG